MTRILNARIIASIAALVFAGAIIASATGAFFSDTETSTGNTFTAGDIDLQIDNESYVTSTTTGALIASPSTSWDMKDLVPGVDHFFDFEDLKPGDVGEDTISIHVGSNNAWMCAAARITSDLDNSMTEPEDESSPLAGDGTADGDLDTGINFMFWHDDGDNVLEVGETPFLNGSLASMGAAGQITLADSQSSILGGTAPIPGDTTFYIGKAWCYGALGAGAVPQDGPGKLLGSTNGPLVRGTGVTCDGSAVGNEGQTDSVEGDLQFYATQSRNNASFTCSQYTPTWPNTPPAAPDVGSDLNAFVDPVPASCNVTVDTGNAALDTIQEAVDAAAAGNKVCVPDGIFAGNVIINKSLTLSGSGATSTSVINGVVEISANDVTVEGFSITGAVSSAPDFAGIYVHANTSGHTIRYNQIDGTDTAGQRGILFGFDVSNTLVTNNVLSDWATGAYVNPTAVGNIDFTFNDFNSNTVGIGSDGMNNADITRNEFDGNSAEAIGASDLQGNVIGNEIHENNFIPAGAGNNVNIYESNGANALGPVDAENNWWDSEVEASRTNFPGTVVNTVDTDPAAGSLFPHN